MDAGRKVTSGHGHAVKLPRGQKLIMGKKTLVMGVLNVTPDSFSDGGRFFELEDALAQAIVMSKEGADIIDVGGESTRPGARPVPLKEELRRTVPVVRELSRILKEPLSIDTRRPEVADAAIKAGAAIVNDVGGLGLTAMRSVVRRASAGAIVMHMRGTPSTMQEDTGYTDLLGEVYSFLKRRTDLAIKSGIPSGSLMVDPGLGFGKSAEGSLNLLTRVGELHSLGFPVVVGASRKSFLGALIGGAEVKDRFEPSIAAAVVAAMGGADIVRVHDVGPTVKALKVVDAAIRKRHGV